MSTAVRSTIAVLLLSASTAAAQTAADVLDPIRLLYASAEYEEALTALGQLRSETPATGLEINRYQALCLIALNRDSEADRVIETIVAADPLYQPSASDASPHVRAAFSTVRARMLPPLARSLYLEAKAAYDRKAYADAAQTLQKTVRVIDTIDAPAKTDLADLRVLAAGFLELSEAAATPPSPTSPTSPSAPSPTATPPAAPESAVPKSSATLTTGLVTLKQVLPRMPYSVAALGSGEFRGELELQIDERGNVTDVRIVRSVQVLYDPILLKAARDWKYEAPRVQGVPIATVKRVEVVLKP